MQLLPTPNSFLKMLNTFSSISDGRFFSTHLQVPVHFESCVTAVLQMLSFLSLLTVQFTNGMKIPESCIVGNAATVKCLICLCWPAELPPPLRHPAESRTLSPITWLMTRLGNVLLWQNRRELMNRLQSSRKCAGIDPGGWNINENILIDVCVCVVLVIDLIEG